MPRRLATVSRGCPHRPAQSHRPDQLWGLSPRAAKRGTRSRTAKATGLDGLRVPRSLGPVIPGPDQGSPIEQHQQLGWRSGYAGMTTVNRRRFFADSRPGRNLGPTQRSSRPVQGSRHFAGMTGERTDAAVPSRASLPVDGQPPRHEPGPGSWLTPGRVALNRKAGPQQGGYSTGRVVLDRTAGPRPQGWPPTGRVALKRGGFRRTTKSDPIRTRSHR